MEIPEGRALFVIILLADLLNTIIREIIIAANGDPETSALAAVIMFGIVAVLFFGFLVLCHFIYFCVYRHHYTSFVETAIQLVGGLLYFYGDNMTYILRRYGPELGCDSECVTNNSIASSFALGTALIIFQVIPHILLKFRKIIKGKPIKIKYPSWVSAIDMITIIIKMDALFSAVVVMVESSEFCSRSDIGTSVSFIVVCTIVGIFAQAIYWLYALRSNKDKSKVFIVMVTIAFITMMFCFPMYVLADNHQPLDCAFGCDFSASNTTIDFNTNCDIVGNAILRFFFVTVTFILIAILSPIFFICQKRNAKVIEIEEHDGIEIDRL